MDLISSVLNLSAAAIGLVTAWLTLSIARSTKHSENGLLPVMTTANQVPRQITDGSEQYKLMYGKGFRFGVIYMCLINIVTCLIAPFIATVWRHHPDFKAHELFQYALSGVMGGNASMALLFTVLLLKNRGRRDAN